MTPVADDAAFMDSVRAFIEDPGVDCAVISNVPLTKALQTLPAGEGHSEDLTRPGGFAARTIEIFRATDKPVVVNIDSGALYDPLAGSPREGRDPGLPAGRRGPPLPEDVRRPHVPRGGTLARTGRQRFRCWNRWGKFKGFVVVIGPV